MKVRLVYTVDVDLEAAKQFFAVDTASELREEMQWKYDPTLDLGDEGLLK